MATADRFAIKPKVLIVHARGGVGDVVLSTPVIQAVWRGLPGARITMLVRSGAAPMVEHNPYLTDRIVVPEGVWDRGAPYRTLLSDIRRRQFDIGMVLWSKAPEAWLLALAGIPVRVGQAGRTLYSFLYTVQVPIASERGDTTTHWTDIQLEYARRLGLPVDRLRPTLVIPPDIGGPVTGLPADRPCIGLSVGKGLPMTAERWPVSTFARLADAVGEALQATIVLTGSPAEAAVGTAIAAAMRSPHVNLTGQTTLLQLGAVMQHCQAFICPDSGPMHMAAALGVPTVGLFAMRCEFPQRWRPYGERTSMVRPDPVTCPVGCQKETCANFQCYEAISVADLVAKVRQVIGEQVRS